MKYAIFLDLPVNHKLMRTTRTKCWFLIDFFIGAEGYWLTVWVGFLLSINSGQTGKLHYLGGSKFKCLSLFRDFKHHTINHITSLKWCPLTSPFSGHNTEKYGCTRFWQSQKWLQLGGSGRFLPCLHFLYKTC